MESNRLQPNVRRHDRIDWAKVADVIEAEQILLDIAQYRALAAADFDRIIDAQFESSTLGDDLDEGPLSEVAMLVAGVMAAVAALSGAGCIYRGQRCGRPDVATWAQTETALAADLLCGGQDPRSSVVGLLERALAALPPR